LGGCKLSKAAPASRTIKNKEAQMSIDTILNVFDKPFIAAGTWLSLHWFLATGLYYVLFFLVAVMRRKIEFRQPNGYFYVKDFLLSAVRAIRIPLIVTALGLVGMIHYTQCTDYRSFCSSENDELCIEQGACTGIVVYDNQQEDNVNWMRTSWNSYGAGVLRFHGAMLVVGILVLVCGIAGGVSWLAWCIIRFVVTWVIIRPGRAAKAALRLRW
jgi:hypothetical protein